MLEQANRTNYQFLEQTIHECIFSYSYIQFQIHHGIFNKQFALSSLPFVWDDPTSPTEVQQVAVDLGNGALRGRSGSLGTPRTACLVTANFDMGQEIK